ncbi:RTA1 like protein-domain-containing protein [Papiliotrema laurentii]|uniref:RTA1 like protein-domain-containing protein n=1 Tax=Papiliotrema laurentii TaxID=5418 RepID=A0AAD9FMY0_PAPLA|nr:RTA1 like protein-domain-containing protein [Papiliotrema laurentii]
MNTTHGWWQRRASYDVDGAIALYDPNGPAAIIAFLVFGAVAVAYWIRYFRAQKPWPRYMLSVILGTTFTSLGYLCRFTRRNHINAWSWLFETIFILCSPCAFLAQIYVLLPRLAADLQAERLLPTHRRFIKSFFIVADVTTVLAQLAGTALTITFGRLVKIGHIVVTVGLWVQLVCFLSFVVIYVVFGRRLSRAGLWPDRRSWRDLTAASSLYVALGACCGLMFIRSIYRVAEYTAGGDSTLARSETAFYILDTVPMLCLSLSLLVVWAPAALQTSRDSSLQLKHRSRGLGVTH